MQGRKVAFCFFPWRHLLPGPDPAEVVKPHKDPVPPTKPLQNNPHPAGNEPGGNQAFRVHANRCPMEALPAHLPELKGQKQGPDHRTDRVVKVRNQLNRQQGKGLSLPPTHKAGNGDLLLPESGKELNGMSPIGGNLSIAIRMVADGA